MANHRRAERVTRAWALALCQRRPTAGRSMPTARGSPSGAARSRPLLPQPGMHPRMRRKGTCGDNAVAERFLHTFKPA